MIACIVILSIAFYWLLRETDYLRVRLGGPVVTREMELLLEDIDISGYDDSDRDFLPDYTAHDLTADDTELKIDNAWEQWLEDRYADHFTVTPVRSHEQYKRDMTAYYDSPLYQHRIRGMYQNRQVLA